VTRSVAARSLLAEAMRVARSQPATTTVTVAIAAVVAAVILATTGQTVQQERQVLARIDDAGTRSIVITDIDGGARLDPEAVERIAALDRVEWVIGLGPAQDGRNSQLERAGWPVPVRRLYGSLPDPVVGDPWNRRASTAVVGSVAQRTLGLPAPVGGLTLTDSSQLAIVGAFHADEPLAFLNRSAMTVGGGEGTVRSIHIVARRPDDVAAVAAAAVAVVGAEDLRSIAVETSETLAQVRAAVRGELGRFGRRLVTIVLGVGLALISLNLYGSVTGRRRDFGRRRALGATRAVIILLITGQTLVLAAVGAVVGAGVGTGLIRLWTSSDPDWAFVGAIILLTATAAAGASLPVAVVAAYRDPVTALRIP